MKENIFINVRTGEEKEIRPTEILVICYISALRRNIAELNRLLEENPKLDVNWAPAYGRLAGVTLFYWILHFANEISNEILEKYLEDPNTVVNLPIKENNYTYIYPLSRLLACNNKINLIPNLLKNHPEADIITDIYDSIHQNALRYESLITILSNSPQKKLTTTKIWNSIEDHLLINTSSLTEKKNQQLYYALYNLIKYKNWTLAEKIVRHFPQIDLTKKHFYSKKSILDIFGAELESSPNKLLNKNSIKTFLNILQFNQHIPSDIFNYIFIAYFYNVTLAQIKIYSFKDLLSALDKNPAFYQLKTLYLFNHQIYKINEKSFQYLVSMLDKHENLSSLVYVSENDILLNQKTLSISDKEELLIRDELINQKVEYFKQRGAYFD